ncbi:MAG TPA: glycosyltransferase family 39 protein [Candidatus Thermoplasmatota archaeon]|nr:glycosyltransferase family 39 protein [Candidatus Thermoplasmatota archaeon]
MGETAAPLMERSRTWASQGWAFLRRHTLLVPLFLLALFLRLNGLTPTFFYGDDAEYAAVARSLAANPLNLEYPNLLHWDAQPFVSQPPVVLYLMAMGIWIGGATPDAVVVTVAVLGALTIPVVYGIGTVWRNRATGVAAAVLLAVMPYHVRVSRTAFVDAGFALMLCLAILCALLWYQRRTTRWAALAGVTAGLALLSKLPGILILPVLGLFVLVEAAYLGYRAYRDRAELQALKTFGKHVGVAFGSLAGVVLACLLLLVANSGLDDLGYKLLWQLGRVRPEALPPHLAAVFMQELTATHREWTWYLTNEHYGLVKLVGIPDLLLGVGGILLVAIEGFVRRRRDAVLLVAWPLIFALFFASASRKEWFYLMPLVPAIAVLAGNVPGAVVEAASGLFVKARSAWHRPAAAVALLAVFALAAVPAYAHAEYSSTRMQGKVFGAGYDEAAAYIDENAPPGTGQIGNLLGRYTLYWYNERPTYHWYVDHQTLERLIEIGHLKYLVTDNYLPLEFQDGYFDMLIRKYHGESVKRVQVEWGVVEVWEFHPEKAGNGTAAQAG